MKQLYDLLGFIDEFEYDYKEEKIEIRSGKRHDDAAARYETALNTISTRNPETRRLMLGREITDLLSRIKEFNDEAKRLVMTSRFSAFVDWEQYQWFLDIALDAVRQLPEDQRSILKEDLNPFSYHFGLGLSLRNRYILCAKKHHVLIPDSTSWLVIYMIFSIVDEAYDYRREYARIFEAKELKQNESMAGQGTDYPEDGNG